MNIALVGDFDAQVSAHQAVPLALAISARSLEVSIETHWLHSSQLDAADLSDYDAFWFVPLSPYQNPGAIVEAIGYVRTRDLPFLGTCAGYQQALLEYARNCLGFPQAQSLEDDPDAVMPLITSLGCRLEDAEDRVDLDPESRVGRIYQQQQVLETYNCGYGLNPEYRSIFEAGDLQFCGFNQQGDPRVFELPRHRFFVGCAFQPERSAFRQIQHPLIDEFIKAA